MAGNDRDAQFIGILGTTGSGKSTELKRRLNKLPKKKLSRLFVWSPKEALDDYAGMFGAQIVRTAGEVHSALKKAGESGAFRLVFVPTLNRERDMALFDVVCKMLLAVGSVVFIVEELHSVTTASHAPDGWTKINFMGRGYGVEVFGLSQRPASCDKAFMGSLSFLHVGRLPHPPDQKAAAEIIGIDRAEIARLSGYDAIQKNMVTGEFCRIGRSAQRVA